MEPSREFWARAALAVARRPSLWASAIVQLVRCSPRGWWRHPPFLPRPDGAYTAFRLTTQYGTATEPDPTDLVTYLGWCRDDAHERRRVTPERATAGRLVRHRR